MSRRAAAAAVVLVVSAAGCGSDDGSGADPGEAPRNAAYVGVCRALAAVKADDPAGARTIFEDEAHGPLHDLSARVDDEDRAVAARLLEAKQAVEEAVKERDDSGLRTELEQLAAATADAVTAVEGEPGPCPG